MENPWLAIYYAGGVLTGMLVSNQDVTLTLTVTVFSFILACILTSIIDYV